MTTFARSAPKKIKSPFCAPVRSRMAASAASCRFLTMGLCKPSRLWRNQSPSPMPIPAPHTNAQTLYSRQFPRARARHPRNTQCGDAPAGLIGRSAEDFEIDILHGIAQFSEFELNSQIGFIGAKTVQRFAVTQHWKRFIQ